MPDSVRVTVDCAGLPRGVRKQGRLHRLHVAQSRCRGVHFDLDIRPAFSLSSSFSGLPQLLLLVLVMHQQGVQLRMFLRRATLQASSREFVGAVFPLPVLVQCGNIAIQLPSESMPQV